MQFIKRIIGRFRQSLLTIVTVYNNHERLKPGIYIVSGRVAIHIKYKQKLSTLRKTKGKLGRFILIIVFPKLNYLKADQVHALCRANPNSLLFFDCKKHRVTRIEQGPYFTEHYLKYREQMQTVIPGPAFQINEYGTELQESWVHGLQLAGFPKHVRLCFVKRIITDLLTLAETDDSVYMQKELVDDIIHDRIFKNGLEKFGIEEEQARNILSQIPLVPSHGDFGTHHILIDQEDYYVIDWDYELVGFRPLWYDLISLFEKDDFLQQCWGKGEFEKQLKLLQKVIGRVEIELLTIILPLAWSVSFCSIRSKTLQAEERERMKINYVESWYTSLNKKIKHNKLN